MDANRLQLEQAVFARKMPGNTVHFCGLGTAEAFVAVAARTNRGNIYTIHIKLRNFPEQVPAAYVTTTLRDRNGEPLTGGSAKMHVLGAGANGWTRICHYGYESWTPMVSLYKVFIKCRLWLEMYELHLQTGKPIDYYLSHQA